MSNRYEEIMLNEEQKNKEQKGGSFKKQDNHTTNTVPVAPAPDLESFIDFTVTEPVPPLSPNRNNILEYDKNHWSRLLNNAGHMAPGVRRYLMAMYNAGVRLIERKENAPNGATVIKLKFIPGVGEGWQHNGHGNQYPPERAGQMLREIMTALYTYMLTTQADNTPANDAITAAVQAGGRLAPCALGQAGIAGFRFDWSRVGQDEAGQAALAQTRALMDQVGGDVVKCVEQVAATVGQLGMVVTLTEMAEVEDAGEIEM